MSDALRSLEPLTADQRRALVSPTRLEIVGHFVHGRPMSVPELADRMGRSTTSVYHHVGLLVDAGLLREAGKDEGGEGRNATLYEPSRTIFGLSLDGSAEARVQVLDTMAAAFRMAERDLEATLDQGGFTLAGPERDLLALRLHARLTPQALAGINEHLDGVLGILREETARPTLPPEADGIYSLTLALLPLRGRSAERGDSTEETEP